jgi:phenol hydroxylase P3 protein
MLDRVWYLSVPSPSSTTPSPPARSSSWSRSASVRVRADQPAVRALRFGAAYNGDMGTMTFGFSAQSDEARHMTLGLG